MNQYVTEQFANKIRLPIICRFDGMELNFENGVALADHKFDKKYENDRIETDGEKIVVDLKEWSMPSISWVGEEETGFF